MVEVLVEHDYAAKQEDELSIKKGDIIRDVVKKQDGWCEGVLNERKGLFPDNFVKVLDTKEPQVVLRTKTEAASRNRRQCRVLFSYNQDHEDELSLSVGDVIQFIGEEEEGWWRGVLKGKEGVFPSNFVEFVPQSSTENLAKEDVEKDVPKDAGKVQCVVRYSYAAQNDDELTLNEGDKVTILDQKLPDPGWWRGELNGKVGVFPDNFVEPIPTDTLPKPKAAAPKQASVASQRKFLESKPEVKSPPVPSKKPSIGIKKSASSLLTDLKKKVADVVDGGGGSKQQYNLQQEPVEDLTNNNNNNGNEAFDQVERKPLLTDIRATRAKPPGRRPTSINNLQQLKISSDTNGTAPDEQSPPPTSRPESPTPEIRPKVREWEKHKAPWLSEMKQHQAKRASTSPGSDKKIKPEKDASLDSKPENDTVEHKSPVAPPPVAEKTTPVRPYPSPDSSSKPTANRLSLNLQNSKDVPKPPTPSPQLNAEDKSYQQLLERLKKLELQLEKQSTAHNKAMEDLQAKLSLETEMRMMLQEKVEKLAHSMQV